MGGQRLQRGPAAGAAGVRRPGPRRAGLRAVVLDAPDPRPRAPAPTWVAVPRAATTSRSPPTLALAAVARAPARRRLPVLAEQPDRHGAPLDVVDGASARRPRASSSSTRRTPSSPTGRRAVTLLDRPPAADRHPHDDQGVRDGRARGSATSRRRPAVVDALRLVRLPYHLSALTQAVARAALAHTDELLATVEAVKAQRDRIVDELARRSGSTVVPTDANFVLFGPFDDPAGDLAGAARPGRAGPRRVGGPGWPAGCASPPAPRTRPRPSWPHSKEI